MMASSATLIGLFWACLAVGPESKSLITQLGSPRFAEREAASEALEKLGPEAFPILKEARKDRDPEVKSRAEVLLDAIERSMLSRPTPVVFDGRPHAMAQMVEELGRAEGAAIQLGMADATAMTPRVFGPPSTVPFWEAVDRLDLVPQWEQDGDFDRFGNRRETKFRLVPRQSPRPPLCDFGPFRVAVARPLQMLAPELQGFDGFPRRPGEFGRKDKEVRDLVVPIDVYAEPRLGIRSTGPIKVHEALDDQDQPLNPVAWNNDFEMNPSGRVGPKLSVAVRLKPSGRPGKAIATLRGSIPVEVESRKAEPTVIPLEPGVQSERKPLAFGGFTLQVHGIVAQKQAGFGGGGPALDVTLRPEGWENARFRIRRRGENDLMTPEDRQFLESTLEVVDSEGRAFRAEPTCVGAGPEGKRFLMTLSSRTGAVGQPAEIRYYGRVRTQMEIPFQFRNPATTVTEVAVAVKP